ncbi:SigE family RNA polymerase sigma factor [Streptodolium elevatio]|uniref:SigE family RNA polymerase sigma factor n=1 Tax=Streptodolium elevatio TaxID=3157996 RepID=A0ABV3DL40_9ACTN
MTGGGVGDFEDFAHARSGQLLRTACLLTGDWHLAEDLVQDTLGKLFRKWRRVSAMESPVAYAHTTLVRTFVSAQRLRRSSERPDDSLPDTAAGASDDIDLRVTLMAGLSRLSPQDRAVLVLRYWEDRSVEVTAEILRVSPGAVRTRSKRALDRLRVVLGADITLLAASC